MLELLAQTTLIDWLNDNAPAIQAISTVALVVITYLYARSVKAHVEQDRALFDLQRQDRRASLQEDALEVTEQMITQLCDNYQIEWQGDGPIRMAVSDYVPDATTLINIGADPKTIKALDTAYKAIRKHNKQILSFEPQAALTPTDDELARTPKIKDSWVAANRDIAAALNAMLADPKTGDIAVRFKDTFSS